MACKGCLECILKLLNFLLTITGLAMIGYGIYLLIEWKRVSSDTDPLAPSSEYHEFVNLGRPILFVATLTTGVMDNLPKPWFIYLFICVGIIVFIISFFGCIGAITRNGCCLSCYSLLVVLLILLELGCAAFVVFDHKWKDAIPTDETGDFDMMYEFLKKNWKIVKWIALGAVVLEALVFLLAITVRAINAPPEYDSDDEYTVQRSGVQQPLLNRQSAPVTGVPAPGNFDHRPSRSDAWSTRMKEKYGLDTSKFMYNQPPPTPLVEERSRCCIL